ncbi:MAG: prephenate dehydratase [Flavobacteriaceae bacterium]|nr:prephenate dehydratase [Flavobacteriaceae bacterium]
MKTKIAIQGIESSFHHVAAKKLLGDENISLIKCDSFDKVTNSLESFRADFGVLAIENTIAGAILPNYNLIDGSGFVILDEVYLNIQLHLMALDTESIHDIKEVHSHPVALLQCKEYLRKFPPQFKVIEGKDTASEAMRIKEQRLEGVAAIAGEQVAEEYGLKIMDRNIQSMKQNATRFVLIGKKENQNLERCNKATIRFELDHEPGSLSNALQLFNTFNINLTKIQSLPIVGRPWQYAFFVDLLFEDYELFSEVVTLLEKAVKSLKVLGVYRHNKENKPSEILNQLAQVDGK